MNENFNFPFPPYDIQVSLMKRIFDCIDERKIGIFESPTGTGKSLSVICATLTWLENFERVERARLEKLCAECGNADEIEEVGDWVAAYRKKFSAKKKAVEAEEKLEILKAIEEAVNNFGKKLDSRKRNLIDEDDVVESCVNSSMDDDSEEEFIDKGTYSSDCEDDNNKNETSLSCLKIFYATRTHSQLEQFIDEIFKTRFRPRIVTVGSRQVLCLNDKIRVLKSTALMNEKCNELRSAKTSVKIHKIDDTTGKRRVTSHCPFYKTQAIEDLRSKILSAKASTVFKVISYGKNVCACPYFASKQALPLCQLVLLPYQVLLHKETRRTWGVSLKDNIVIIDEAHNLHETIASTYSTEITQSALNVFEILLQKYITRYKSRLCTKNLLYLRQLHALTIALKCLMKNYSDKAVNEAFSLENFLVQINSAEINLFKLLRYMENTGLCKKLHGFFLWCRSRSASKECPILKDLSGSEKILQKREMNSSTCVGKDTEITSFFMQNSSPVYFIKQFIESLTSKCADSRVIFQIATSDHETCFKYVLLNTAEKLYDIVSTARAVVLVGGTMEPADYLLHSLYKVCKVPKEKILRFSCNHVIDDSQLLALSLGKSVFLVIELLLNSWYIGKAPNGLEMTLNFANRLCASVLNGLAMTLMNLLRFVTNGAIVFFQSYDYMYKFESYLKASKFFEKINMIKTVIIEQKTTNSADLWNTFARSALSASGGVLFAVVGGKLSEGINFSDELGRCVFMVGLPYSNKNDIELSERMKYLDLTLGPGNGSEMYESLCLHAVNQAIGRVIRHRNDFAAIVLIDNRFSQQKIIKGLPCWIRTRLKHCNKFGEAVTLLSQFFKQREGAAQQ